MIKIKKPLVSRRGLVSDQELYFLLISKQSSMSIYRRNSIYNNRCWSGDQAAAKNKKASVFNEGFNLL